MTADDFADRVAGRLAALPGVRAVTLGGSRAQGTHRPDSDWDLVIYYRGEFRPRSLREIGWPGEVSETARAGRFRIEPLLFHLAGIPSYLVVAELAINRVLRGDLPRPDYPEPLRRSAPGVWWGSARLVFDYARANHAARGRPTQCAGLVAQATCQAAHAVLAARGERVTNEKMLPHRPASARSTRSSPGCAPSRGGLRAAVDEAYGRCAAAVRAAGGYTRPDKETGPWPPSHGPVSS